MSASCGSNGGAPITQTWSERLFTHLPIAKSIQRKTIKESKESLIVDVSTPVDPIFEVNLVDGEPPINVNLDRLRQNAKYGDILIQDVVKEVCSKKAISPISTCFFGLKCEFSSGTSTWIVQTMKVDDVKQEKKKKFFFRLQFKVLFGQELRKRDNNAYLYYLKQCRYDFKTGAFAKQLEGKDNEKILLRIVILEMMMLKEEISKEEKVVQLKDILKNKYRKYFSIDDILKKYYDRDGPRDMTRCRQKVEKSLSMFSKVTDPDKDFLTEIELLCNFREQIFYLQKYERENSEPNPVELWVSPRDIQKKVVISNIRTSLWEAPYGQLQRLEFCEIDQKEKEKKGVKFRISRAGEPREEMYCPNEETFESICSYMDGYYRLLVDQYNSIIYDSSPFLHKNPYFGPIHRDVAAKILSNKGVEPGTYLIREQQSQYGGYTLSCVSDEHEFLHIQIQRHVEDNTKFYAFYGSAKNFETLEELCKHYSDGKNSEEEVVGKLTTRIHPKQAGCIPLYTDPATFRPVIADKQSNSRLQLSSGQQAQCQIVMLDENDIREEKLIKQGTFGKVSISHTCGGRQSVVVKRLDTIKRDEFLELYNTLKSAQHENIVCLVGISLSKSMFLANEYMPLGSLETYLNEKRDTITYGSLLKYLMQITEAVAFLHSQKFVHGDLSLGNIYMQDANTVKIGNGCIKWKLANVKSVTEIIYRKRFNFHAPEIILNKSTDFTQHSDIWSFGLTIWQLFTLECPFKKYSMEELNVFFNQHMKVSDQPGLVHLNMHKLPYSTDKLFSLLNGCLRMEPEERLTMEGFNGIMGIKENVSNDILKKAPSKDKKKYYFIQDMNEDEDEITDTNITHDNSMEIKVDSMDTDGVDYTSVGALTNGDSSNVQAMVPDLSLVKNEEMETNAFCDENMVCVRSSQSAPSSPNRPRLQRSTSLNDEGNRDEEEIETASILVDMSQTQLLESEKLRRSQLLSSCVKTEVNPPSQSTCMLGGHTTQLPLNTNEDLSYTKDLSSWTKVTHLEQLHPVSQPTSYPITMSNPMTHHTRLPTSHPMLRPILHPTYSMSTDPTSLPTSRPTLYPISFSTQCSTSHPMPHSTSPHLSHPSSIVRPVAIPISQTSPPRMIQTSPPRMIQTSQVPPLENNRFTPSPHMPPDSPEAVRREFTSEHTKRDLPRNEKTRLYLQERINKERDRFHGKRSLSFTDEFEEYKNNTIRAAKRALLGPNPFNIGIHLPDNFVFRTCPSDQTYPLVEKMSKLDTHSNSPSPRSNEEAAKKSNEHIPFNYQIKTPKNQRPQGMVVNMINNPVQAQSANRHPYYPGVILPLACRTMARPAGPVASISAYPVQQRSVLLVNPCYNRNEESPCYNRNEESPCYREESPYVSGVPEVNLIPVNHHAGKCMQIDKKTIRITDKKLGAGAFGQVLKGVWTYTQNKKSHQITVAIKSVIASNDPDYEKAVEDIRAEATHLATLNNDNDPASNHIIKLFGLCVDDGVYQIVEEFAQNGQLDFYIAQTKEHIKEGDILNVCKQVAVGMDYMHKKNVFHRDLACRNILVTTHLHVKISDFGMSRQPGNKEYYKMRESKKLPVKWCALESITRRTFTTETDMWSYGVAAWEMYTVYQKEYQEKIAKPYCDVDDCHLADYLEKGNRLPQPSTCPDDIWKRLVQCWHADPKERPTFRELKDFFLKCMDEMEYVT